MNARCLVRLLVLGFALGCEQRPKPTLRPQPSTAAAASSAAPAGSPPLPPAAPVAPAARCPDDMAHVAGGPFWVGSERRERFSDDESPRYRTELASFCMDLTEVTAGAYQKCVERGACSAAEDESVHCTGARDKKTLHPINCVTWKQADTFCKAEGKRLPSEVEFEYVARGGEQYLKYPWGDAAPDGHTCWKHNGTCAVKTYAAGAFGLYDISGNVWEWTADWYGPYPWPPEQAHARVYRGGSFSRRFEKWMHTRLRNRSLPREQGSHLGFRCARTVSAAPCPFGTHDDGSCRHGVHEVVCDEGKSWNGVRCAAPGQPRCADGRREKPGFGCVLEGELSAGGEDVQAEAKNVRRQRTPEFDADCRTNLRDRPQAFRYVGGTHQARNLVGKQDGCKNRDVGVGWNSACCP